MKALVSVSSFERRSTRTSEGLNMGQNAKDPMSWGKG